MTAGSASWAAPARRGDALKPRPPAADPEGMALPQILHWLFPCAGAAAIACGLWSAARGRATHGWPTAPGRIVSSALATGRVAGRPGHAGTRTFAARVTYEYEARGRLRRGARIAYQDIETSSRARAEERLRRYAEGAPVLVRYDPRDPDRAVLEPGVPGAAWLQVGAGALFVGIALFVL